MTGSGRIEPLRGIAQSPLLGIVREADARRTPGLVPASERGDPPLLVDFAVMAALVELGATRDRGARLRPGQIAASAGLPAHDIRPALSRLAVAELILEIREPMLEEREYFVTELGAAVVRDLSARAIAAWRHLDRERTGEVAR